MRRERVLVGTGMVLPHPGAEEVEPRVLLCRGSVLGGLPRRVMAVRASVVSPEPELPKIRILAMDRRPIGTTK
jgi:hypothetical protein